MILALLLLALAFAIAGFFFFGKRTGIILECISLIIFIAAICIDAICIDETHKSSEKKFPASEYSLEYEITMRGEQVDTVYVLTRKL